MINTANERERLARNQFSALPESLLRDCGRYLDLIDAKDAEIERLRGQIADIIKVVEGDWGFPVSKRWRRDGKPSKHDQCMHGYFMWQDCGLCAEDAIRSILEREP